MIIKISATYCVSLHKSQIKFKLSTVMPPKVFVSDEAKISLLEKIFEKKDLLFGPFTEQITRQGRIEEWQRLYEYALIIGYKFPENSDFSYLRDTVWPNFRKRTEKKRTFAQFNEQVMFNKVDEIVLKITETWKEKTMNTSAIGILNGDANSSVIGILNGDPNSSAISILNGDDVDSSNSNIFVQDFIVKQENDIEETISTDGYESLPVEAAIELVSDSPPTKKHKSNASNNIQNPFVYSNSKNTNSSNDSAESLLIEQRRLQNENLRLKNYKTRLEIYALERQLNLEHYVVK